MRQCSVGHEANRANREWDKPQAAVIAPRRAIAAKTERAQGNRASAQSLSAERPGDTAAGNTLSLLCFSRWKRCFSNRTKAVVSSFHNPSRRKFVHGTDNDDHRNEEDVPSAGKVVTTRKETQSC